MRNTIPYRYHCNYHFVTSPLPMSVLTKLCLSCKHIGYRWTHSSYIGLARFQLKIISFWFLLGSAVLNNILKYLGELLPNYFIRMSSRRWNFWVKGCEQLAFCYILSHCLLRRLGRSVFQISDSECLPPVPH